VENSRYGTLEIAGLKALSKVIAVAVPGLKKIGLASALSSESRPSDSKNDRDVAQTAMKPRQPKPLAGRAP